MIRNWFFFSLILISFVVFILTFFFFKNNEENLKFNRFPVFEEEGYIVKPNKINP